MEINQKEIEESIKEIIGEEALILINELKKRKNQNEFNLAEKLNLTINQVRNLIYKLDSYNLVSSIRKKDKKKGWYVYYWTYHQSRAKDLVISYKEKRINKLKNRIEDLKKETYYFCPRKCITLNLISAMENNFRCPECNYLLLEEDKEKKIRFLKRELEMLEKQLLEVRKEEIKKPREAKKKEIKKIKLKVKPKPQPKKTKSKKKIKPIKKSKLIKKLKKKFLKRKSKRSS
jgi:transcription factor E